MKNLIVFFASFGLFIFRLIIFGIYNAITSVQPNLSQTRFIVTQNPITGRSRGQGGGWIFYTSFGKNVARAKPLEVNDANSEDQQDQRSVFSEAVKFCRQALAAIQIGFNNYRQDMSAYSYALKQNLLNAPNSQTPPDGIDLSKTAVSKGNLIGFDTLEFAASSNEEVTVTWRDNSGSGNALATDGTYFAWSKDDQTLYGSELAGTVKRAAETASVRFSGAVAGNKVRVYAFLGNADLTLVSDSVVSQEITLIS